MSHRLALGLIFFVMGCNASDAARDAVKDGAVGMAHSLPKKPRPPKEPSDPPISIPSPSLPPKAPLRVEPNPTDPKCPACSYQPL
jgi:hypothetical protein